MTDDDYAETLLNMIMDEVEDILLIHDSENTLVWMNRAGLKAFEVELKDVIGNRCYTLFNRTSPCEDCDIANHRALSSKCKKIKVIPKTNKRYVCTSLPLYRDGEIKLVVQHLRDASLEND